MWERGPLLLSLLRAVAMWARSGRVLTDPTAEIPEAVVGGGPSAICLRVLGPVGLRVAGVEVAIPAGKPRFILALLGTRGGGPVSSSELVLALWGEDAGESAAKTLQVHVSTLRKRLKPFDIALRLDSSGY
jgi:hypothetical protein